MIHFGSSFEHNSDEDEFKEARENQVNEMPNQSNSTGNEPTPTQVSAVSVKLPPFWTRSPRIWFTKVECQFTLQGISNESTKFAYVMSVLNEEVAEKVMDVIENPGDTPYTNLKNSLIEQYTLSEERRIHELLYETDLGDKKPSELFKYMKSIVGSKTDTYNDAFLLSLWEGRLPGQITAILKAGNFAELKDRLACADRVFDALRNVQVNSVHSSAASDSYEKVLAKNKELEAEVNELKRRFSRFDAGSSRNSENSNRNRSRSRKRNFNPNYCFYHNRFGKRALKCNDQSCKFKSEN